MNNGTIHNRGWINVRGAWIAMVVVALLLPAGSRADTRTWVTGGAGRWDDVNNWDGSVTLPGANDDVVIDLAGANVLLTNSVNVLSLTLSRTLTFTNWTTCLTVTNDVTIESGGVMTCAGPFTNNAMSNRVCLVCSNLLIDGDGAIDVKGKGYAGGTWPPNYAAGNGPGAVGSGGGSHGGAGRYGVLKSDTYDDPTAPMYPGSGGRAGVNSGAGGNGGGAVCITAAQVVVNGKIDADATAGTGGSGYPGGGSGGAIYIVCSTIGGTNGTISANGGGTTRWGGGGGCIAVLYDPEVQTNLPVPALGFSVAPGMGDANAVADIGTLYFPDSYFLSPTNLFTGQWLAPLTHTSFTPTNWCVADLLLSNTWIRLPCEGLRLTITNALTVISTDSTRGYLRHKLELTNAAVVNCGSCSVNAGALSLNYLVDPSAGVSSTNYAVADGVTMNCSGDLSLTNRGRLYVGAGLSCSGAAAGYGAVINVGGNARVCANSWVYLAAHPTNGAAVLLNMHDMAIDAGGGINADYLGYAHHYGPGLPPDTHATYHYSSGAGYGGRGSPGFRTQTIWGPTYGSSNAPVAPGSGGRGSQSYPETTGPAGGGSVQIRAEGTVSVHGTITANGQDGFSDHGGAASGGGIYVYCRTFIGDSNGVLRANGGNGRPFSSVIGGGGGGGGRIAVWSIYDSSISTRQSKVLREMPVIKGRHPALVIPCSG